MKRIDIERQIDKELQEYYVSSPEGQVIPESYFGILTSTLTDLFIQLSEERCREQRISCEKEFNYWHIPSPGYSNTILNAPFPTLD